MGKEARGHGTWSKVYDGIDDHPKTRAAAAVLAIELGLSEDYAAAVVVRAVGRLMRWAIRESDSGRTGHLSDFALTLVGWPAGVAPGGPMFGRADAGALRRALRAVPEGYDRGFLYDWGVRPGRAGVEFLHEFHFYAWDALKGRSHYRGSALADFRDGPAGNRPSSAALGGPPAIAPSVGSAAAARPRPLISPPSGSAAPSAPSGPSAPRAAPAGGAEGPARGSSEVGGEVGLRFGRKSLAGLDDPSRISRGDAVYLSIRQYGSDSDKISPEGPGGVLDLRLGPGWAGVPAGVRGGDPDATGAWLRSLSPMSHAGLYAGAAYVARFREHAGLLPPGEATDPTCGPGRALELLAPDAWAALVGDLVGHLPQKDFPRKYSARALASRWEEVLGKAADAASKRRAQWRRDGRG